MKYRFFSLWMEFPIAKLKLTVQTRIVREKIHRYQFSILFIGTRSLNGWCGCETKKIHPLECWLFKSNGTEFSIHTPVHNWSMIFMEGLQARTWMLAYKIVGNNEIHFIRREKGKLFILWSKRNRFISLLKIYNNSCRGIRRQIDSIFRVRCEFDRCRLEVCLQNAKLRGYIENNSER